jgi:ABC-type arginine transport system permease subunit
LELVFLINEGFGPADLFYLRALNILFIYYGANRMLKVIIKKEKTELPANAISALTTALIVFSLVLLD